MINEFCNYLIPCRLFYESYYYYKYDDYYYYYIFD